MKLATIALASVFALSSTFALAQTRHQYTSQHKYKSGVRTHQGTVGMGQGTVGMGRSTNPAGGRTTEVAWLAARTPVPTSPKSKRRVSAGLFCALFDRSSAAP